MYWFLYYLYILGPILLTHYLIHIPVLIILNWFLGYYLLFWFLYSGADTDNEQRGQPDKLAKRRHTGH